MRTVRTKVYKFDELGETEKLKALCDHANFIAEFMWPNSVFMKSAKKMDRLKTPWFLAETILHEQRDELIEEIRINEYEYTAQGRLYRS